MVLLFGLPFMALQGLVIFFTAWAALRWLGLASAWWKPLFMVVSWAAWCTGTITVYFLIGGDGGLMGGMGLMLMLCASAFVSTLAYAAGWAIWPLINR